MMLTKMLTIRRSNGATVEITQRLASPGFVETIKWRGSTRDEGQHAPLLVVGRNSAEDQPTADACSVLTLKKPVARKSPRPANDV
jgi:hypothetical protein